MKCFYHAEEEAIVVCVSCKKPLCEDCRVKLNDRNYCDECLEGREDALNDEIKGLSNIPHDVVKAAARADDYLSEKGVYSELNTVKEKGSDKLKSLSSVVIESTQSGIKNLKQRPISPLDEIEKAKQLLDMGAITEEEFEEIKKKNLEKL